MDQPSDSSKKRSALSFEMEEVLWSRKEEGEEEAREKLILAYRPLVFWMAKKFTVSPSVYPDIIQEGMMALIKAVDNFDRSRKSRFSTYAFYRVRGQMINYIQRGESKAPCPVDDTTVDLRDPFSPDKIDDLISIGQGMEELPEREAQIISSIFLKGRNAKDVALDQKLDVSHVYRLKRRGLSRLRAILGLKDAKNEY